MDAMIERIRAMRRTTNGESRLNEHPAAAVRFQASNR